MALLKGLKGTQLLLREIREINSKTEALRHYTSKVIKNPIALEIRTRNH